MNKHFAVQKTRQPRRPHYIEEWAQRRGFDSQAALANELNADKSMVSRWYAGTTPSFEWQERLAGALNCEPESLFRHPDDDWMTRFLRGRSREEVEKIKRTLEIAFPLKTGTNN